MAQKLHFDRLYEALARDDYITVDDILDDQPGLVNLQTDRSLTPLMQACWTGENDMNINPCFVNSCFV